MTPRNLKAVSFVSSSKMNCSSCKGRLGQCASTQGNCCTRWPASQRERGRVFLLWILITALARVAASLPLQGKSNNFGPIHWWQIARILSRMTSCDYLDNSMLWCRECTTLPFFGPWGMVLEGRLILPSWYSTTMMTVFRVRRAARCSSRES